jgi:hypothetical protein
MDEIHARMLQTQIDTLKAQMRTMREEEGPVETAGGPPNHPPMNDGRRSSVDNRLGELKGAIEGLRSSFGILAGAVALVATVMTIGFGFNRLDGRIDQLAGKVEAIPQRLSDEFRAMRTEIAVQTSTIANAITCNSLDLI